jgi:hypothetical protein
MLLDKVKPEWKTDFMSKPRPLHEIVGEVAGEDKADEKERGQTLEKAKAQYKLLGYPFDWRCPNL